jgi:hypothetical protein
MAMMDWGMGRVHSKEGLDAPPQVDGVGLFEWANVSELV